MVIVSNDGMVEELGMRRPELYAEWIRTELDKIANGFYERRARLI